MGSFMGLLFTVAMAGLCLCYIFLMHSSQNRYHSTLATEPAIVLNATSQPKQHALEASSAVKTEENSEIPPHHYLPAIPTLEFKEDLRYNTDLKHIVFGIGASAQLWEKRKEYVKLWWKPKEMRGYVWFDERIPSMGTDSLGPGLPPWRISSNTSRFRFTHKIGWRSAIRISRIVSETVRLGLPDVEWFVMGDDDTVFVAQNLVTVLSKYDHREFYYIGGNSESHIQNQYFTYNMAFGGGGFAISYPLAIALEKMQDKCLERYHHLFGSDDRVQACVSELGVPLTKEPGFHQFDINGNPFGLLAAHPIAPLVSLHHMDVLDPFFSTKNRVESVKHLLEAARFDPGLLLQQSMCYDRRRRWSISVSWGYAVQIYRGIVSPRELENPLRTFSNWQRIKNDFLSYPFNTRALPKLPCQSPIVFELSKISHSTTNSSNSIIISQYKRPPLQEEEDEGTINSAPDCPRKIASPQKVEIVKVSNTRDDDLWLRGPRRNCCQVKYGKRKSKMIEVEVGACKEGEIITMYR